MTIAIQTKFLGATNHRGARVKAFTSNGQALTISYRAAATMNPFREAAEALRDKMGWKGALMEGKTKEGSVFVFLPVAAQ